MLQLISNESLQTININDLDQVSVIIRTPPMKKWIKHTIIFYSISMFSVGLAGASITSAGSCSLESRCCAHSSHMPQNEKRLIDSQNTYCCMTASQPCPIQQTTFPSSSLRSGAHTYINQNPLGVVSQPLSAPTTQNSLNPPAFGGKEGYRKSQAAPLYLSNLSFLN
jgi:hypothetical protein